jgi:tRNA threonylcarbamoyl adenosine modification protein YeaZ
MRILALDSATVRCSATVVSDTIVIAGRKADQDHGQAATLTAMARDVLALAAIKAAHLDLIAITVGPGSFTGIRAALALGLGIGISSGVPVVGVTVGEALADSLPFMGMRTLWTAVPSRRGRVFLEIGESLLSRGVTDLPPPGGPIAVAGSAALDVAARLAASGANVMLTDACFPQGRHIAIVGERRLRGDIRPLLLEPAYIDAPEAKVPPPRTPLPA